ncbi:hypothetical protein [Sphingorhabdus sp. M41]|uniref:hypothetical protein n=1 Tax=Sphingorhabdus sp. M41 TaxID=1806885 RepID=UPI00078C78BE|nr:hypothetical protein [Sphingorhabdus sp. M41]AMO70727.1 hypothetical protein AZE99_01650 [Sphingorhabdus sp. M41]
MKKLPALVTIITVTLSGCAMQEGDFPSLQKRPYEDESVMDEAVAPAAAISSLSADLQIKLDAAVAQSRAAHDRFQAKLPAVKSRVDAARGAAVSSESWVVAHMELAALEIQRSPSVEALADIDAIFKAQIERETAEDQTGGTTIIEKQRDAVQAQVDRQQAEIETMKNRLR